MTATAVAVTASPVTAVAGVGRWSGGRSRSRRAVAGVGRGAGGLATLTVATRGEQSLMSGHLLMFLVVELLQQQVGTSGEERVRWLSGGDHRNGVAISGIESTQHVEDLAGFPDRLPDVAQSIGQLLEASAVLIDGHVALVKIAELGLQVHSAMKLVVAEQLVDGSPDGEGSGARDTDDVEHISGDRIVHPIENALIDHAPFRVTALSGGGSSRKVGIEAELAHDAVEEGAPLGIVRIDEIKDDRNMRLDVHGLKNGRRRGVRRSGVVDIAGRVGGGAVMSGVAVEIEQWVGWHGSGRTASARMKNRRKNRRRNLR